MRRNLRWIPVLGLLALTCGVLSPSLRGVRAADQTATVSGSTFVVPPYLQNPGPTHMTLMWVTAEPAEVALRYGTGDALEQVVKQCDYRRSYGRAGELPPTTRSATEVGDCIYKVRLTGLKPGTLYHYGVTAGRDKVQGSFRTWPDRPEPFSFAAYGDTRTGHETARQIGLAIAAQHPAFIIHTGDMVLTGAYEEWKPYFFDTLDGVINHIPLLGCRGNHESGDRPYDWLLSRPTVERWYSFDYGNAHFVALDIVSLKDTEGVQMLSWLEKDLAASKADWKFVFYHWPSFDAARHTAWGRKALIPLLRKGAVDVVLSGHSHSYQRLKPMFTAGENDRHPITYIVTAGGGAPLGSVEYGPYVACGGRFYNYSLFSIDGRKLAMRTFTPDGKQVDACQISKQADGALDAAYLAQALPEKDFETIHNAIFPALADITVTELPQPGHWVDVPLQIGAGPYRMKFKLHLDVGGHYRMRPAVVEGESSAGGTVPVKIAISAKGETTKQKGGNLIPAARIVCEYEIDGQKGSVLSEAIRQAGNGG